jgi:predicted transcriptional regulator
MLVHELMTRSPVTVQPATHVKEALGMLDTHAITSMPVVDADGRIVGVVSEADLVREAVAQDPRAHMMPSGEPPLESPRTVAEVMSRHPLTVTADTDLAEAVDLLTSSAVKSVPVVDERGRTVGMLSRRDVVHALARTDDRIEAELDELFRELGGTWSVTVDEGRVTVEGVADAQARALAETAAATVTGVRSVHVV